MKLRDVFVRNRRSSALLERFLVASVTTILVIRFFLATTGYPQLGGRGLHIAHMLWGGLLMLIALILSLAFLGRRVQTLAALLGGIGFGAFIDELGKFITSDNNYFFQPTIALIYVIFIVLLLSFRILERSPYVSEQERLANALNILEEAALHNLSERDKEEILWLLRAYDVPASPLHMLADAVERMPVVSASRPGLLKRITRATRRF
jgi:crotonobetainyl-CoA:carnitine CoA-transferase CaiB-like acyl-CoA transferase